MKKFNLRKNFLCLSDVSRDSNSKMKTKPVVLKISPSKWYFEILEEEVRRCLFNFCLSEPTFYYHNLHYV